MAGLTIALETRVCTKCGTEKSVEGFYRASPTNRASGRHYQSQCKECTKEKRRTSERVIWLDEA